MITNDQLLKLFVWVPAGVSFNGAEVTSITGNQKKIYFDENTQQIWVKGKAFSLDKDDATKLTTLIGSDSAKSVRTIAGEVVNTALNLTDNADATINTLKEVLNWFNNLPEGDAGALALVNAVGKPASGTPGEQGYTAATGLYKLIEDSVSAKNVDADGASGELLVDATASNNKVEVSSTTKLQNAVAAAETSIQSITVAGTALTVSGNANAKAAEIAKSDLQSALFTNTYQSSPLTYSYLGVKVDIKESNGELTYLNVDPSSLLDTVYSYIAANELVTAQALTNLDTRVDHLEEFDPWETYSAS